MISGGTGITPMMQVVRAVVKNHAKDKVNFWLISANQTEEDILLRSELDAMAAGLVGSADLQFKVHYTLDRPPADWAGSAGFITTDMCREHLPAAHLPNTMIFLCGPSPMIKFACEPALKELGFDPSQCFTF
jgi:cytochrome-b5 reductase